MKVEQIIKDLKTELCVLMSGSKDVIDNLSKQLSALTKLLSKVEENWVGQWASPKYNDYKGFFNSNEVYKVDREGVIKYIENESELKIEMVSESVHRKSQEYKDFQEKLVTEVSIIKSIEKLTSELQILNEIENFEWGVSPSRYVVMKRPGSFYVDNPSSILNRGIDTPPHLRVGGEIFSLVTILESVRIFEKLVTRLLRQIEIKLSIEESSDNSIDFLHQIIDSFHQVVRQLQHRHDKRSTITIQDEYDVQDLLHAILRIGFEDVRPEEYTPSYAGSSTRVDFLLKKEKTIIEIKKTRKGLSDKEVGEQLILDSQHYKVHPDCKRLICFVYDAENKIQNPRGLEEDLNRLTTEEMLVEVYIRP